METVATNTVEAPDFTGVVKQQFFIEPKGGPKDPVSYLDRFPDTIYNKAPDSNLVALMYTILGPAGIGWLRKNYLEARLEIEANGLSTIGLDELYANPLSFARAPSEIYEEDTEGLLSHAQWEKIVTADAAYRNRAIDFLKAVRAGGTLEGITLAAKSGLNRPVEVIENYRALYDSFSDDPLGLEFIGVTTSTEEVIVLPRQNLPKSTAQTLSFLGNAIEGKFSIFVPLGSEANGTTAELEYNSSRSIIQSALEALPVIGSGNVVVSGGPTPSQPVEISFIGELADRPIAQLIVTTNGMRDINENEVIPVVEIGQVGVSTDGEVSSIAPRDWHYAQTAIGKIKPVTTIVTPGKAPGITTRQIATTTFSGSSFTKVIRYVTGLTSIHWPPVDSTHWIEAGKENEAPTAKNAAKGNYRGYHNISKATAYTETALEDPLYETDEWPSVEASYRNEQIGPFSPWQTALYPFLSAYKNPNFQFSPSFSLATPPEALSVRSVASSGGITPMVQDIYPADYQNLPGVANTNVVSKSPFWASVERTEGTDYLEIDLGVAQAVNYISFEASSKPNQISVDYDLLDLAPARKFKPVSFVESELAPSTTALHYEAARLNPWTSVTLRFANSQDRVIFTRFIRIGFQKNLGSGSPFVTPKGILPSSIEIRNLRAARDIP